VAQVSGAAQTPEGAVRAATAFATGLSNVAVLPKTTQATTLNDLLAPTAGDAVRTNIARTLEAAQEQILGPVGAQHAPTAKIVTSPLSYHVDKFGSSNKNAHVTIWVVTVLADPTGSVVQSAFSTTDIQLVWTDHWRIVTYDGTPGPTPPLYTPAGSPSKYEDVIARFNDYTAFRYATH
jgi:hypothetical protein